MKKQYPTIETFGYSCNVANSIEVENAFNAAINKFGKITNIISNASLKLDLSKSQNNKKKREYLAWLNRKSL